MSGAFNKFTTFSKSHGNFLKKGGDSFNEAFPDFLFRRGSEVHPGSAKIYLDHIPAARLLWGWNLDRTKVNSGIAGASLKTQF